MTEVNKWRWFFLMLSYKICKNIIFICAYWNFCLYIFGYIVYIVSVYLSFTYNLWIVNVSSFTSLFLYTYELCLFNKSFVCLQARNRHKMQVIYWQFENHISFCSFVYSPHLLMQLVQQFLTENIPIEGSGPEAKQSQLYIGEFWQRDNL